MLPLMQFDPLFLKLIGKFSAIRNSLTNELYKSRQNAKRAKTAKKAKTTDITKNLFLTNNFVTVPFGDYDSSPKKTIVSKYFQQP